MFYFIAVGYDTPAKIFGTTCHTCNQMGDISARAAFSRSHQQVAGTEHFSYFILDIHHPNLLSTRENGTASIGQNCLSKYL